VHPLLPACYRIRHQGPSAILQRPSWVVTALKAHHRYMRHRQGIRLHGSTGEVQLRVASDADDAGAYRLPCCTTCPGWVLSAPRPKHIRSSPSSLDNVGIAIAAGSGRDLRHSRRHQGRRRHRRCSGEIGIHNSSGDLALSQQLVKAKPSSSKAITPQRNLDRE
jgi:hypothetical protein